MYTYLIYTTKKKNDLFTQNRGWPQQNVKTIEQKSLYKLLSHGALLVIKKCIDESLSITKIKV